MKVIKPLSVGIFVFSFVVLLPALVTYPAFKQDMQAAHERLSSGSKILRTDKHTIEYAIKGEGVPLLLLHGAGGGYDQGLWAATSYLGGGYKLISVSRFGYLRSPLPSGASIKSQASAYRVLLDHLNIDSVIVVGGSAGGSSAMQFANDYPDRTQALILLMAVSMADHSLDNLPLQVRIIDLIQQSNYLYWVFTRLLQSSMLELVGIPSKVYEGFTLEEKELAQAMLDNMHPSSRRNAGTYNDNVMIQDFDLTKFDIPAPTLIVHAKDDALVGHHHAEHANKYIKHSKLFLFENGGHAMLSKVNDVRKLTKEFISKHSRLGDVK